MTARLGEAAVGGRSPPVLGGPIVNIARQRLPRQAVMLPLICQTATSGWWQRGHHTSSILRDYARDATSTAAQFGRIQR